MAALGGVQDLLRSALKRQGLYDGFVQRVDSEWSKAFPVIDQGLKEMSLPPSKIKQRSIR